LIAQLNLYAAKAGEDQLSALIQKLYKENNNDFSAYINKIWDQSLFTNKEKVLAFLDQPDASKLQEDPLVHLSNDIISRYRAVTPEQEEQEAAFQNAFRLLVRAMHTANPNIKYSPDAKSTLRLTYGKIRSLLKDPSNGAKKNYFTAL